MKNVFILYTKFLDSEGNRLTVGGIQTYIRMLSKVIQKNDMNPIIMQHSNKDFISELEEIRVIGVKVNTNWSTGRKSKLLFNKCIEKYYKDGDIIIIATHSMAVKNNVKNVIGIQHGITFDIRKDNHDNAFKKIKESIRRTMQEVRTLVTCRRFNHLVAVDYNFLNWYRTMPGYKNNLITVVPNCTNIYSFEKKGKDNRNSLKIIFARRFQEHRGTRLFASAAEVLLEKNKELEITFAGDGPDKDYLEKIFDGNDRVNFITYASEDSIRVHKDYDIAVIPTIGSEGTSLSLLEAMAAKCSVVATNVGGITNILLDNYNGLIINPNVDELIESIQKLVNNQELRHNLSENAYQTVSQAFTYQLWEERWSKILSKYN